MKLQDLVREGEEVRDGEGEGGRQSAWKGRMIYDAEELEGFGGSQEGQLSQECENESDVFDAYAQNEMKRGRKELDDEVDERRKRRNDGPEFQVRFPCLPFSPFAELTSRVERRRASRGRPFHALAIPCPLPLVPAHS